MFVGTGHVWRTKTWGMGTMTLAEFREHCNEWTDDFAVVCGDWQPLGDRRPPAARLIARASGDRAGRLRRGRRAGDGRHLDAVGGDRTGRVFISKNADADPRQRRDRSRASTRWPTNDPNRFVSGIYVDPRQPEPRLDLLLGLQRDDADARPGTCSR